MKVVWTGTAEAELQDINDYIAADNPVRALSFAREIVATASAIGDMPHAFPVVRELGRRGVRRRVHGRYLILYRATEGRVEILHVVHSARDYVRALFSDEF